MEDYKGSQEIFCRQTCRRKISRESLDSSHGNPLSVRGISRGDIFITQRGLPNTLAEYFSSPTMDGQLAWGGGSGFSFVSAAIFQASHWSVLADPGRQHGTECTSSRSSDVDVYI